MFYSGVIIFFGIHLVPLIGKLRVLLKDRLGEGPYMGLFSLISLTGILLIIFGYESNSNFQYSINGKAYVYAKYIMFFALTLNIAAVMPTYIKKYTKHPMSLGIAIWAVSHLLVNPDTVSIILFGSFLTFSCLSVIVAELRESVSEVIPKIHYDIFSIVLGIALTFLAYNFHEYLSGVKLT
jgi:uncharacterized membrane protein|tara:strand:- start:742 stop:1284 length:543 start_codon:yes stop_codon:yes gene_type:complete